MPGPTMREGHVDMLLTNISVAFMQSSDKFVAGKVFPVVPVAKAGELYNIYPRGYFFRDEVGPRPMGGKSNVAGFAITRDSYFCEEEGLSANLDDRERANATPPYDPERSKTKYLTQQHLIHRDRKWAGAYFQAGVWSTDVTGVAANPGAGQFLRFDNANSTPIELVDQNRDVVAESTGFEPNTIVCGRAAFRALKNHPDVIDRIKYTAKGIITADLLAELFGVQKFLVPGGVNNLAPEGAADIFRFIVDSRGMLLCYSAPEPALDQPSAGYSFSWTGLLGQAAGQDQGLESVIWRGRDDRAHSDWFECRMAYDMKQVAADLGVFFATCVD